LHSGLSEWLSTGVPSNRGCRVSNSLRRDTVTYFRHGMTIDTSAVKALDPESGRVETVTRDVWLLSGGKWSRDGRHVAYTNGLLGDDGKGLFLFEIGASDQPKRVLVEAPIDAYSWSADGQRLAVIAGRRDPSAPEVPGPGLRGYRWELRFVDLQGHTSGNVLEVDAHTITWSPDGVWVVLERYSGFDVGRETSLTDIWLVHPDGTGLRRLTSGAPTATSYGQAAWVPESVVAKAETAG